jgi:hypothetical protein
MSEWFHHYSNKETVLGLIAMTVVLIHLFLFVITL